MHHKSNFQLVHWLLFIASLIMLLHLDSGESQIIKCSSGGPHSSKTSHNRANPTHSKFEVSQNRKMTSSQKNMIEMLEKLRKSEADNKTPRVRYLKFAVLVEYNIYDKHFNADMQETLTSVQDLFYRVTLDFKELDVILSLAGVIVWTQPNIFEMSNDLGRNHGKFSSYLSQFKSLFNYDHVVRLRSGSFPVVDISDCVGAAPYKTLCSTLSVSWATMYVTKSESVDEFSYSSSIISHEMGHSVGFEHRDNCPCGEKPPAHCRMFSTYKKGGPLVWDACSRMDFQHNAPLFSCLNTKPKTFRIRTEYGQKRAVLDVSENVAGSNIILQAPQNTASQQWYIGGDMTVRSILNDFCLTSNGPWKNVTMEPCDDRRDNKFVYNYWTRTIQVGNMTSSGCLRRNILSGTFPMETPCSNKSDQSWKLEGEDVKESDSNIVYTGLYFSFSIRSRMGAKRVLEASTDESGLVVMNDSIQNSKSQKWYIANDKTLRSALNNNCLVSNGPTPSFSKLEKCDSRRDNKWVYNQRLSRIEIATNSSRCLDISNGNDSLGSRLAENDCNDKVGQEWNVESESLSSCTQLDCESGLSNSMVFYTNQVPY